MKRPLRLSQPQRPLVLGDATGSSQVIAAATEQIALAQQTCRRITVSGGADITLTSAPHIPAGYPGQVLMLFGPTQGIEGVILQNHTSINLSGCHLNAATRKLGAGQLLTLVWDKDHFVTDGVGGWVEVSYI